MNVKMYRRMRRRLAKWALVFGSLGTSVAMAQPPVSEFVEKSSTPFDLLAIDINVYHPFDNIKNHLPVFSKSPKPMTAMFTVINCGKLPIVPKVTVYPENDPKHPVGQITFVRYQALDMLDSLDTNQNGRFSYCDDHDSKQKDIPVSTLVTMATMATGNYSNSTDKPSVLMPGEASRIKWVYSKETLGVNPTVTFDSSDNIYTFTSPSSFTAEATDMFGAVSDEVQFSIPTALLDYSVHPGSSDGHCVLANGETCKGFLVTYARPNQTDFWLSSHTPAQYEQVNRIDNTSIGVTGVSSQNSHAIDGVLFDHYTDNGVRDGYTLATPNGADSLEMTHYPYDRVHPVTDKHGGTITGVVYVEPME